DLRPGADERGGDRGADAAGGTGDQRRLPGEIEHGPTLPRRAAAASVAGGRAAPPHLRPAPVPGAPAGGVPVPALAGLRVGRRPGDDVWRHGPDHLVAARAPVRRVARAARGPADPVGAPPPSP